MTAERIKNFKKQGIDLLRAKEVLRLNDAAFMKEHNFGKLEEFSDEDLKRLKKLLQVHWHPDRVISDPSKMEIHAANFKILDQVFELVKEFLFQIRRGKWKPGSASSSSEEGKKNTWEEQANKAKDNFKKRTEKAEQAAREEGAKNNSGWKDFTGSSSKDKETAWQRSERERKARDKERSQRAARANKSQKTKSKPSPKEVEYAEGLMEAAKELIETRDPARIERLEKVIGAYKRSLDRERAEREERDRYNCMGQDELDNAFLGSRSSSEVKDLLASGANINATNKHGETLLIVACRETWEGIIEELLKPEYKADVTIVDNYRHAAVSYALLHGNFRLATQILERGGYRQNLEALRVSNLSMKSHAERFFVPAPQGSPEREMVYTLNAYNDGYFI